MRIRSSLLAIITIAAFIIGIGLTMAFNLWKTEASKTPVTFREGEHAGQSNPADIHGSYTLQVIADAFPVPVEVLAKAFFPGQEGNPGEIKAKELEQIYGHSDEGWEIGTDSVRLFVAKYAGLPFTPKESTRLPESALPLLKDKLSVADFEEMKKLAVKAK
ncbi:MAG: hypothetical protein JW874_13105 [Spirochaetales bacterium]|nr:hypothetical protein [Spirochaetales bacterium]